MIAPDGLIYRELRCLTCRAFITNERINIERGTARIYHKCDHCGGDNFFDFINIKQVRKAKKQFEIK